MLNKHRGELYLILGAIFFSMNGVVVTLVLDHMSTFRLAQVRALGTFALLLIVTLIQDRNSLKAERREIPTLIVYGVIGCFNDLSISGDMWQIICHKELR